jgi:isochorismate synthase
VSDAALELLLPGLSRAMREESLAMLTFGAPVGALARFLAAPIPGEALLWEPAGSECGEAAWAMAGRGIAARFDASGDDRLTSIRERADAMLDRLEERREPAAFHAPPPRVFGGLSFRTGDVAARESGPASSPWASFGEASFVLPRWLYGERDGAAFLRFCVPASELSNPDRLESEIAAVRAALAIGTEHDAGGGASGGAATVVEETAPSAWDTQVRAALASIRGGALKKVVLARQSRVSLPRAFDLVAARHRLLSHDPACLRFAMERGDALFFGATPERLVEVYADVVACDALGGTAPRRPNGRDANSDGNEATALFDSVKDRREHQAVIDGIRASLSPFCRVVESAAAPSVRTLRSVHHLHTQVTGRLRRAAHVLDVVAALHPTPAVCGLPRAAAGSWIAANEPAPRGWYAAPIGWFDLAGEGCFAVGLRSALVRGNEAWLFAGAGIVDGSDPALEYRETATKLLAMRRALGVDA